ncbi:MAG: RNase adapter RapZ, partial [Acidimicrobiales bacterium]
MAEFVVVAGLSGAGRTTAANVFEDLGWYVIDNLPPALIPQVADLARRAGPVGPAAGHVVLVVGRSAVGQELLDAVEQLRVGSDQVSVVFLDAPDDVLVRRFEDRRRRHPLSGPAERMAVAESIAAERSLLQPVKEEADLLIDTSELNVHQLRERVLSLFGGSRPVDALTVSVVSFGFKHGLPLDADMVFDVRFLPNPHWVPDLRPQSGLDPAV